MMRSMRTGTTPAWRRMMATAAVAAPALGVTLVIASGAGGWVTATAQPAEAPAADASPRNAFGVSVAPAKEPGAVRLATYNMLNFFDEADDPSLSGEFDDAGLTTAPDRRRALAAAIRAVDADVWALQEVESKEALEWFRDAYLSDMRYSHIASIDVGYFRGVECSVMSRYPITHAEVWTDLRLDGVERPGSGWATVPPGEDEGLTIRRSPLRVDIRVNDEYELTVFSLHHKSGGSNDWWREAEAVRVVERIDEIRSRDPYRNIVVMGDFNAAPWDKSFRVYLEAGMIDTLAHRIVPRWREAPQDEARLYKTHESDRVIDYILVNSAAHRELVIGSAFVFGTLTPGPDYNWREDPHPPGYASDHYPVAVDLTPRDRL
ncbi:MAG: endonuclease/exonuclease/phosphatase family protein [Phycisphaerales bacterium]